MIMDQQGTIGTDKNRATVIEGENWPSRMPSRLRYVARYPSNRSEVNRLATLSVASSSLADFQVSARIRTCLTCHWSVSTRACRKTFCRKALCSLRLSFFNSWHCCNKKEEASPC